MSNKVTLNDKFEPLFTSKSRYYCITGGRGSSKSFSVSLYLIMLILVESDHTILFTRYTMKSAHISIIPEIVQKIDLLNKREFFSITKDSVTCTLTGSKILFRGIKASDGDQTANLKSIEGATIFVVDEAEEFVDENSFDTIDLSIRSQLRDNKVILILNPTTKEHWIYRRFFENRGVPTASNLTKNDTTYIHTTYLDNKENLGESWVKKVEQLKTTNPLKYEHIILGGWRAKAEGVIFTNWQIGKFDENLDYGFGLDFGFSADPTALTKVAIDKENKRIYLDEVIYRTELTSSEIIKFMKQVMNKELVIADSAEPRLIEEIKRAGLNIRPCVKGAGSIAEGIFLMTDYKIIVTEDSTNIIKELNNYIWNDRKSGQPIDMFNHAIDGIRYYVSHNLKKVQIKKFRIY